MSTSIPGRTVFFLEEHSQRGRGPGVACERTVLSLEADRRHSSLCWVWWTVETRGEPPPVRGPGEEWSVCRWWAFGDDGEVYSHRVRFYAGRANEGDERVWKRGDHEMGFK